MTTKRIDLNSLWDFKNPELSEQRFRTALAEAGGDDELILQTQIARSYGLRRDFARAQAILNDLVPALQHAGPEAQVRHALEIGRTLASAAHPPESQTEQGKEEARSAYRQAFSLAQAAQLDGLAIDALHMLAFVDAAPEEQLKWGQEALAIAQGSSQPDAQKWEASLRNNIGYALHKLERYQEALTQFQIALKLREEGQNTEATRVAQWMVAWTLRSLEQYAEALAIQLRLDEECETAGTPDPYVFEELIHLYRVIGDGERAELYVQKHAMTK